jgi:hypothetical protein
LSRSYGSILPTSLTCLVPSTRGCAPWSPAAVGYGRMSLGPRVSRSCRPTPWPGCCCFAGQAPSSARVLLQRDACSLRAACWRCAGPRVAICNMRFRNVCRIPFRCLRTDSPAAKHSGRGTLLHFSLRGLHPNLATTTKICSVRRSRQGRPQRSTPRTRPPTRAHARPRIGGMLSAIHFQGWSIRQVSCYTLLGGFRLPWPPSCCPNRPTPFMGSFGMHFGTLARRLVHPTSPVLLTRIGPLGAPIVCTRHCTRAPTHSEFENGPKRARPASPNHWLYRMELSAPAILRDISAETSYQTVRLVFRPYAHIVGSICTSEPLCASTRVSAGFTPCRHRSLSFGSQRACSCLSARHVGCASRFCTLPLARAVHSLVRVSRRDACPKMTAARLRFRPTHPEGLRRVSASPRNSPTRHMRFPPSNFTRFSLSLQSAFHLSLAVLVCYRSPGRI